MITILKLAMGNQFLFLALHELKSVVCCDTLLKALSGYAIAMAVTIQVVYHGYLRIVRMLVTDAKWLAGRGI